MSRLIELSSKSCFQFRYCALLWRSSTKHKPQRVGKEHLLEDEDIVQIIKKALSVLKLQKGNQMLEDYPRSFREPAAVFQHAQVYIRKLRSLLIRMEQRWLLFMVERQCINRINVGERCKGLLA